jgi:hypothetical protein
MNESVLGQFDDTGVYAEIIDEGHDIDDRLAHGRQLTPRQARQVRRLLMQWSPPEDIDDDDKAAEAANLFGHRLKRFTRMLRAACYEHEASDGRTLEDLEFLLEMAEAMFQERPVDVESAVAMAALRGVRAKASLLEARGGCLGTGRFAELLGVQRETPRKRWESGKLIGVRSGKRLLLPVWQLRELPDATGVLRPLEGIPEVIATVHANHGNNWDVLSFFLSENIHLIEESNGTFKVPIDALKADEHNLVAEVAEMTFAVE